MPNGLLGYYLLDAASLLPVICLDVGPDSTVLDMCASPGGKTVAMMQLLSERGGLVANEPTQSRRRKLRKVIQEYIPKGQTNITIRGMDGTKFGGLEPCSYDRILVDAPCSTDRHCLRSGFQTDSWSEKKSQKFSQLQNKLVMSALGSLTSDGRVVYSTCTMSPYENDGVIQGVLENFRHGGKNISIERISEEQIAAWGEMFDIRRTEHGFIVLPSVEKNWGPLYTSSLVLKS
ncbi:predicted protein [Nematostella vectensis]|uniref:NOL1/NOP2/Sun domain family member 4 n=1 Tax=Nematostella vectensis TaxID=45351 RepID=A7S2N2_NEMVE|nr:predicted protein [Nematostella vectensis]|eukprot:XP_001634133.1 predicted protein [Nematostella vectensis]